MGIRKAVPADFRQMAEVGARAYINDDFKGRYLHPHRFEYPEDFIRSWELETWVQQYDPTHEFFVTVDDESGVIVGYAKWKRIGPGAKSIPNSLGLRKSLDF